MADDDVSNVERLRPNDVRLLLSTLAASISDDEAEWSWGPEDERWELTPHELRKLTEAKRKVTRLARL